MNSIVPNQRPPSSPLLPLALNPSPLPPSLNSFALPPSVKSPSSCHLFGRAMPNAVEPAGRAPRLPRWTRQEILVMIQGKRVVESGGGRRRAAVEPKWVAVAAYCRRHGVDRGPVQCRKRWSNLAGDYKKIKEWERAAAKGEPSFWAMRNDVRREKKLPGFFDREVYDIIDGAPVAAGDKEEEEEEEAVFDSGRTAGEDGLFSDYEEEKEAVAGGEEEEEEAEEGTVPPAVAVTPISEKKSEEPSHQESSDHPPGPEKKSEASHQEASDHPPGLVKDKHPADNPEKGSPSGEGHKRRRTSQEGAGDTNLQSQVIEVLERNNRVLTSHLEAQNVNYQLDRDQRKDHADSLLGVLGKLADALGRIADKL